MTLKMIALIAALAAPVVAVAQDKTTEKTTDTSKTTKTKPTDAEMSVLAHYHHVNQNEIDMGKMAQKMGGTKGVKDYGATLVKDHTQNDKDLSAFAKKHNATIGKEMPMNEQDAKDAKAQAEAMTKLRTMKGADFDREFLTMAVDGHEKELAKIDTNIGQVENPDLQMILKDFKPVLQKHADQARDLQKSNAQASAK